MINQESKVQELAGILVTAVHQMYEAEQNEFCSEEVERESRRVVYAAAKDLKQELGSDRFLELVF